MVTWPTAIFACKKNEAVMFSVLKTNDRGLCAIFHFEEGKFHALLPIKIFDFLVLERDVALWGKYHTYLTKYTFIKGFWGLFKPVFWEWGYTFFIKHWKTFILHNIALKCPHGHTEFIYKRMKKCFLKLFSKVLFLSFFLHISIAKFLVCLACCFDSLV